MTYYIGVDGGGTKTAIAAANQDASTLLFAKTGSASWREYGIETVVKNIKQAIDGMPFEPGAKIGGIFLALTCYGEGDKDDIEVAQEFSKSFPGVPLYFVNDSEAGWAGSLGLAPGINIVAGTGAIAFGKDEAGNGARSGGWSDFFGDEGSCFWLGRNAMGIYSKQSDGRMDKDELYEIIRSELGIKNDLEFIELMHGTYMLQRDMVAGLQLLLMKAAQAGSRSAKALYAEAAQELHLLALAIKNKLSFENEPFSVSYAGGLFKVGELILPEFSKKIKNIGGKLVEPKFGPAEGALLLAFSKYNERGLSQLHKKLEQYLSR